jgi:hypothetical protein
MTDVVDTLRAVEERYAHGHDRPLAAYGALDATYLALVTAFGLYVRRRRLPLPARVGLLDVALIGVATHRLARTIAKDSVTSPIRAPFTRYQGVSGPAELQETVEADGLGHAVGELLTCPFCLGQWVATAFMAGLVTAPRATRVVTAGFSSLALADFLQFAYSAASQATE